MQREMSSAIHLYDGDSSDPDPTPGTPTGFEVELRMLITGQRDQQVAASPNGTIVIAVGQVGEGRGGTRLKEDERRLA